jgi:hypothetical protein
VIEYAPWTSTLSSDDLRSISNTSWPLLCSKLSLPYCGFLTGNFVITISHIWRTYRYPHFEVSLRIRVKTISVHSSDEHFNGVVTVSNLLGCVISCEFYRRSSWIGTIYNLGPQTLWGWDPGIESINAARSFPLN